jgi:hypothetical protein
MLSDREIREIEEGRRRGLNGPVLQTWLDKLLADRREPAPTARSREAAAAAGVRLPGQVASRAHDQAGSRGAEPRGSQAGSVAKEHVGGCAATASPAFSRTR